MLRYFQDTQGFHATEETIGDSWPAAEKGTQPDQDPPGGHPCVFHLWTSIFSSASGVYNLPRIIAGKPWTHFVCYRHSDAVRQFRQ